MSHSILVDAFSRRMSVTLGKCDQSIDSCFTLQVWNYDDDWQMLRLEVTRSFAVTNASFMLTWWQRRGCTAMQIEHESSLVWVIKLDIKNCDHFQFKSSSGSSAGNQMISPLDSIYYTVSACWCPFVPSQIKSSAAPKLCNESDTGKDYMIPDDLLHVAIWRMSCMNHMQHGKVIVLLSYLLQRLPGTCGLRRISQRWP